MTLFNEMEKPIDWILGKDSLASKLVKNAWEIQVLNDARKYKELKKETEAKEQREQERNKVKEHRRRIDEYNREEKISKINTERDEERRLQRREKWKADGYNSYLAWQKLSRKRNSIYRAFRLNSKRNTIRKIKRFISDKLYHFL